VTEARGRRVGLALATVYLVWGSTFLGIRVAVETIPPSLMAGVRFILAGGILYAVLRLRGAPPLSGRQWASSLVIGVLLVTIGNGLLTWSEVRIPSSHAALFVTTTPMWMVVLEWSAFGGERPRPVVLAGLVAGFTGVFLLLSPGRAGPGSAELVGSLVVVVGSLCWAIGSLLSRRLEMPEAPHVGPATQMLLGGIAQLVVALALGEGAALPDRGPSPASLLGLAYLVVVGALVGYTTYMWLLRHARVSVVSTYAYVNPIVAVFLGWLLAGEIVTGRMLIAAAVIVGSVIVIITFRRPSRAATRAGEAHVRPPTSGRAGPGLASASRGRSRTGATR